MRQPSCFGLKYVAHRYRSFPKPKGASDCSDTILAVDSRTFRKAIPVVTYLIPHYAQYSRYPTGRRSPSAKNSIETTEVGRYVPRYLR